MNQLPSRKSTVAVVMTRYPDDEQAKRQSAMVRLCPPEIELTIRRVDASVYQDLSTENRDHIADLFRAEFDKVWASGIDYAIPFGTYDLGVDPNHIDPRLAPPCLTSLQCALSYGQRFGFICYDDSLVEPLTDVISAYGFADTIVDFQTLGISLDHLGDAEHYVRERLVDVGHSMCEAHSLDAIVVMGVSMVPLYMDSSELSQILGVPILDGMSSPFAMVLAQRYLRNAGTRHAG